jgi:hypothetical protein
MDHEKTIIEKLTDAVTGAASSIVDAASNAAETGIKSNAARMSANTRRVAGTANEQIYIPEATDAAAMPVPFAVARAARKKRKAPAKPASAKIPRKIPRKISGKKAAAGKTARKSSLKKAKSGTGRKAVTKKKSVAKKNKATRSRR